MIELVWTILFETKFQELAYITSFFDWLINLISKTPEYQDINIDGYIISDSRKDKAYSVIFCDDPDKIETNSAERLLKILQQPPEEYKEKYIACIPCIEPMPVVEVKTENEESDEDDEKNKCDLETTPT